MAFHDWFERFTDYLLQRTDRRARLRHQRRIAHHVHRNWPLIYTAPSDTNSTKPADDDPRPGNSPPE